ncbi:hypothetical protein MY4824_001393 [Beauveria thailandica]
MLGLLNQRPYSYIWTNLHLRSLKQYRDDGVNAVLTEQAVDVFSVNISVSSKPNILLTSMYILEPNPLLRWSQKAVSKLAAIRHNLTMLIS